MCGIIAYIGKEKALPFLVCGLKNLEYRGYDSAGVAFLYNGVIKVIKCCGRIVDLEEKLKTLNIDNNQSTVGIGHTRWATHGVPNDVNAHPHWDGTKSIVLVHNGIIENFFELKKMLGNKGYEFVSDTDTEVLCHLIAEGRKKYKEMGEAISWALSLVEGSYAICVINKDKPDEIWGARYSSPLVMGVGNGEMFLASDVPAFLPFTRDVIYIEDNEIVRVKSDSWEIYERDRFQRKDRKVVTIQWNYEEATKGGHPHFMLKEILEQPQVIENCIKGRINKEHLCVSFKELEDFVVPQRVLIVACGTSYYAGLWSKYLFETWAKLPVEVEIASEFRYRNIAFDKEKDIVITISQSGETADTLAALRIAKEQGIRIIGLCNVVGSSIAREVDKVIYTYAGPEISVASTKAMTSQMIALFLLALFWARKKGFITDEYERKMLEGILTLPKFLKQHISGIREEVKIFAQKYSEYKDFLYLGRLLGFPLALEGALKLKEISYIHAEGYAAGEMKHGPIALIDENFPTVAVVLNDNMVLKMIANIKEVISRGGRVLIFGIESKELKDSELLRETGVEFLKLPSFLWPLSSFLILPALQLFAYEVSVALGRDVDKPRNLAKSVTVE